MNILKSPFSNVHVYLAVLGLFFCSVSITYAQLPEPVMHFRFDETSGISVTDSAHPEDSPLSLTGTPEWGDGIIGGALYMDGDDRLVIPQSIVAGGEGTFSFWVNVPQTVAEDMFLLSESVGGDNPGYAALLQGGTLRPAMKFQSTTGEYPGDYIFVVSPTAVPEDTWTHVAITFGNGETHIYINGELVMSGQSGLHNQTPNDFFVIGGHPHAEFMPRFSFIGSMDDVFIYDEVFDDTQMQALYTNGIASIDNARANRLPPLLLHMPFNEGNGQFAYDHADVESLPAIINGTPEWADGISGTALQLNADERIVIPKSLVADGDGTYSFWVYLDTIPSEDMFILGESFGGGNPSYTVRIRGYSGDIAMTYQESDEIGKPPFTTAPNDTIQEWMHVVVTFDNTETVIYVNGTEVARGPAGSNNQPPNNLFVIGNHPHAGFGSRFGLQGRLDDVRVYGEKFTPDQVSLLQEDSLPPTIQEFTILDNGPSAIAGELDIAVTTNISTRGFLEYGLTPTLGLFSPWDSTLQTQHLFSLRGLEGGRAYLTRGWFFDASGNLTSTDLFTATTTGHSSFVYAAPDALPDGRGTLESPLPLTTLLTDANLVHPGDTILLHPGTYTHESTPRFPISISGTQENPIVIRPVPSEDLYPVIIDGGFGGVTSYLTLENLEITTSLPRPPSTNTRQENVNLLGGQTGLGLSGDGLRYINLLVHDNYHSTSFGGANSEVYGSILYHNGSENADGLSGHALYVQNDGLGATTIQENVIFDQYYSGIHIFGSNSASLKDILVRKNIIFDQEGPIIYRSGVFGESTNGIIDGNVVHGGGISPYGVKDITVKNNTVINGNIFSIFVDGLTAVGNRLVGKTPDSVSVLEIRTPSNDGSPVRYTIDNNLYQTGNFVVNWYDETGVFHQENFFPSYTLEGFQSWQDYWGLDQNSVFEDSVPSSGVEVTLIENRYDNTRATLYTLNWEGASIVSTDKLNTFLEIGDSYELYNVLDLNNTLGAFDGVTPILSGVYDGTPINIPLRTETVSEQLNTFLVFKR